MYKVVQKKPFLVIFNDVWPECLLSLATNSTQRVGLYKLIMVWLVSKATMAEIAPKCKRSKTKRLVDKICTKTRSHLHKTEVKTDLNLTPVLNSQVR